MVHCVGEWDRGHQADQHKEGGGYGGDGPEEVVEGENDGEHEESKIYCGDSGRQTSAAGWGQPAVLRMCWW